MITHIYKTNIKSNPCLGNIIEVDLNLRKKLYIRTLGFDVGNECFGFHVTEQHLRKLKALIEEALEEKLIPMEWLIDKKEGYPC